MTAEQSQGETKEKQGVYEKAVRILPFAAISAEEMVCQLEQLFDGKLDSLSTIKVYLGQRKEEKRYCDNMLSPYGGLIESNRSVLDTAYLKLIQETNISSVPFPNEEIKNINPDFRSRSYKYAITGAKKYREVSLVPIPCLPVQVDEKKGPEYRQAFGFSSYEFQQLISQSHPGYQVEGHLSLSNKSEDIIIEDRQRGIRNRLLKQVSTYFYEMDQFLKKRLVEKIRNNLPENSIKSNLEHNLNLITPEIYLCEFYQALGNELWPIFLKSYHQIISETYMKYFQKQKPETQNLDENKKNNDSLAQRFVILKEEIKNNNLGVDILHYLPLYSFYPEAAAIRSSRAIITSIQFMRRSLDRAMINVGLDNKHSFVKEFSRLEKNNLQEQSKVIRELDQELLNILSEVSGIEPNQIIRLWLQAQRFIPDFANEIKAADPELLKLYQFHEPLDEINNNSISQTIFYAFGNEDNSKPATTLRFEAARQLALFLKLLIVMPIYDQKTLDIPNPLDLAINQYFGRVDHTQTINLVNPDTGLSYQKLVEHRRSLDNQMLIVDEKPIKGIVSFTRKSFEMKPTEIHDIYAVGIILPEQHNQGLLPMQRIKLCQKVRADFINYLSQQFPDADIETHEYANNYHNFTDYQKRKTIATSGKRTGSQSSRIIREKFIVELKQENKSYFYEMVFYPFETLAQETDNQLMGWREKLQDDPTYGLRRTLFPLKQTFGLRSFYELLFPPEIYSDIARQNATVLQKKT